MAGSEHAATTITEKDGRVTQIGTIAFKSLSDLRLSDEAISLRVLERPFFGLGPTHARFRRTFLVGHARRDHADRVGPDGEIGSQIMASVFGDHTYVFSVTLPGSILRIAPVKLGDAVVTPSVTGDFYHGHTVTWTMPLYRALDVQRADLRSRFLRLWQLRRRAIARRRRELALVSGSANATISSPRLVSSFPWPPAAISTYCRPFHI